MDFSLAKGLKNQLFRELSEEIDIVIERFTKYYYESKPASSRLKWENFCEGIDEVFGPYLLAKYKGGSKRKPFLCIATFENERRQYSSWEENCISSKLIYVGYNPLWIQALPIGFATYEHAIQRIFERSHTTESVVKKDFEKVHFVRELAHSPLWAVFWAIKAMTVFKTDEVKSMKIVIPSSNGLLFGEIQEKFSVRCDIRTFVAKSQLSFRQLDLMILMNEISDKYVNSIIPFLLNPYFRQPFYQIQLDEFFKQTQDLENILVAEHGFVI